VPACRKDPLRGARVNVEGTIAVFEAAKAEGLARVVYASSAAVLGPPEDYPDGAAGDTAATLPRTHYGAFKVANELSARVYFSDDGVSSVGLRPWAVYGPGRDFGMTSAPTLAIQAAVLGVPYRIPYGGMNDLQFVDDVAKAFVASAASTLEGARVYNLRGDVVAVDRVIAEIEAAVPRARGTITRGEGQLAVAFDLDDGAFRRDVPGVPRTPLGAGVRRTVEIFERLARERRLPPLPS
jgi:nucleoside-diphosphate-sugar epimerase